MRAMTGTPLAALYLSVGLILTGAGMTRAQSFVRCEPYQTATIERVLPGAHALALRAAAAIGDTPEFERWFGPFTVPRGETVRAKLKSIYSAIDRGNLRFYCGASEHPDCKGDTYAYVYRTEPFSMTVCPSFFSLPAMEGGAPDDAAYEFGTMEGTIIHEMSHFTVVADTDDLCYSRSRCADMAIDAPQDAVSNADTFQYYAEDVGFARAAAAAAAAAAVDR